MAKRYRMREVEQERGKALIELIPELLNKHEGRQAGVAAELGVTQASISGWLKANGFRQVVKWERVEVSA